jgi:hypothetical protein
MRTPAQRPRFVPAFQELFTRTELDRRGDRFEEAEHENATGRARRVVQLEESLGIDDLSRFTPS